MKLINIGFGNMVSEARIVAIVSPESAPIKRIVSDGKERGIVIDATYGRRTKSVILMDNGQIVLSALQTETISSRVSGATKDEAAAEEENDYEQQ